MNKLQEYYRRYVIDGADPRTKNWPLVESPTGIIIFSLLYLFVVYILGPRYMKNRKPYDLKKIIRLYNLFQVVTNTFIVYGIATSGWMSKELSIFRCNFTDLSHTRESTRMITFLWYSYLLKLFDFIETVFFVLRKKYSQVSFLHVYHHVSTLFLGWTGVKYSEGGIFTMAVLINCTIHALMYTYYYLSTLGGEWPRILKKWKRRMTMLQMTQFFLLLALCLNVFFLGCKFPKPLVFIYFWDVFVILCLFYDYFRKSDSSKKKIKATD